MRALQRDLGRALSVYLALFVALVIGTAACKNQRTATIRASITSVDVARDEFLSWDKTHQQGIVDAATSRDEALANLEAYQQKRKPVVDGFGVVYRLLALAASQSDDLSLSKAIEEVQKLMAAVQQLRGGTASQPSEDK